MSATLAVQKALGDRLTTTAAVTALVPAAGVLDRNSRPAPDPSIILGEDQAVDGARLDRNVQRIYSTVHVWRKETGLSGAKAIADAIRTAIHSSRLTLDAPYHAADAYVSSMRFMRDPDGQTAHGIVTVETLVSEASS